MSMRFAANAQIMHISCSSFLNSAHQILGWVFENGVSGPTYTYINNKHNIHKVTQFGTTPKSIQTNNTPNIYTL